MPSYNTLPDPVVGTAAESFTKAVVNIRFCSWGRVSSNTWTASFLTLMDGVLRFYDSRESAELDPASGHFLKIPLVPGHFCSPLKSKVYSGQGDAQKTEFFSFSLMYDYGIMVPLKQIKISVFDAATARTLMRAIDANSR